MFAVVALLAGACDASTPPTSAPGVSVRPSVPASTASGVGHGPSNPPTVDQTTEPGPPTTGPTATPFDHPTPSPTVTPSGPAGDVSMPFVPVVNFWSTRKSMPVDELKAALGGNSDKYGTVVVPADAADEVADAAGVILGPTVQRGSVADVIAAAQNGGLGFLGASDVEPSVRALGIGDANLFGENRIGDVGQWPLNVRVQSATTWDQAKNWVLVSAGDIMGDRGVRADVEKSGRGPSYLFDGGTAKVDRIRCCSFYNYEYPVVSRTGNAGAVRRMIEGADFAMANLETGVLPNPPFHELGFTFTTDPSYLQALKDGGFDFLSNANNHSKNGGSKALSTAISTLDELGVLHSGAGVGPDAAAQPAIASVNGIKLAVIACDAIARYYWAKPGSVGTNSCKEGSVARTIREIRDSVDVVVVFPHWGVEYEKPVGYQFDLAREWFEAGADMVIGAHSHIAGGIYDYNGKIAMLSMGNFIFDQTFRQATQQGLVVETTWNGNKPVQIWAHPLLNVGAQPDFADPDADGQYAFDLMKLQSPGLDWGGTVPDFDWPLKK